MHENAVDGTLKHGYAVDLLKHNHQSKHTEPIDGKGKNWKGNLWTVYYLFKLCHCQKEHIPHWVVLKIIESNQLNINNMHHDNLESEIFCLRCAPGNVYFVWKRKPFMKKQHIKVTAFGNLPSLKVKTGY